MRATSIPSVGAVPWPPKIGDPLPRSVEVWFEQPKLDWILGMKGHGPEWSRIFRIYPDDRELAWEAIANATPGSMIQVVRDRSPFGISCGIEIDLAFNRRNALVTVAWHYAFENAAPRLVTAYPSF
jgi:hypothetical protein